MMKKVSLVAILFYLILTACDDQEIQTQPDLGYRSVKLLTESNYQFKDLNKNGKLDPYEDWRLSADERVENLLSQNHLQT